MESINPYLESVKDKFNEHPNKVGQTYWEHMGSALRFAGISCMAGTMFAIHSVFPFFFEFTGSNTIKELNTELVNRSKKIS